MYNNVKKLIYSSIVLLIFNSFCHAQKVFSVNYENLADVKVFVVKYENQADLKVFKVNLIIKLIPMLGSGFLPTMLIKPIKRYSL